MKRGKIAGALIGIFFLCIQAPLFVCGQEKSSPEEMRLYAQSAVLMDGQSGRVLYGKNADVPMAMASTTKIMTCIIVLENCNTEETLQVSAYAASMPKVKLFMKQGETYQVKDLLYSLMLESHNDSAVALAEHVGKKYLPEEFGSLRDKETEAFTTEESKRAVEAFAALMNRKAGELGCEDTYFITPNGLDATKTITLNNGETVQREHSTTARELAKIMAYCIEKSPEKESFLQITRVPEYVFSANGRSFSCRNHNAFLQMMEGALSGKTGFTNKAGYCYVGALRDEGRTYVVALLACGWPNNKGYKWSDTKSLMRYGVEQYYFHDFSEEGTAFDESCLKPVAVTGGRNEILGEPACTAVKVLPDETAPEGLLMRNDEKVLVECTVKEVLEAPVKAGTELGSVCYLVDDVLYRRDCVVAADSVEKIDLNWCFQQIWKRFLPGNAARGKENVK